MRAGGPRALAAALLVAVGLLGVAGGVALDRFALRPADWQMPPPRARGPSRFSPESAHRWSRYLARELGLSTQQQARVDSVLLAGQARTRDLAREVHPRFEAITQSTRAQLEAVMTPAQRIKYEDLRKRRHAARAGGQPHGDSAPPPPPR
ncbi:MAG TPA: hypothetical protein VFE05_24695 [Longimicrobiaceae bacterium]|nr:hypothetical protein [Longimicrobiaceae bacterium]